MTVRPNWKEHPPAPPMTLGNMREHRACAGSPSTASSILLPVTQCAPARGVHEVKLPAGRAGYALIAVRLVGYVVSRPALHAQAGIRAAEDKSGHVG